MISPYYFVPLNKEVFYPEWWDRVSHDIPFCDGESGEIHLKITAKKPLYIRNRYEEGDEYYEVVKNKEETLRISKEFCHRKIKDEKGNAIGKEFYIPGSTLRGMTSSILRVLSFAEMDVDTNELKKVLSVRDMARGSLFNSPMKAVANGIGLLSKKDGSYTIEDYSYITRNNNQEKSNIIKIKHDQIKEKYPAYNVRGSFEDKEKVLGSHLPTINIDNPEWDNRAKAQVVKYKKSNKESYLVFNDYIKKKKYEFIIRKEDQKRRAKYSNDRILEDIVRDFENVYLQSDSKRGEYWRKKLDAGEKIPIFLKKSNNGYIKDIGLTQLFKLPYKHTLLDAIDQNKEDKRDLVKTIFGSAVHLPLKGRVSFGHFKCNTIRYETEKEKEETKTEVLSSPKPTFYPNYIQQKKTEGDKVEVYTTLMDEEPEISGWKFYPLQEYVGTNPAPTNKKGESNENVATEFKPLPANTTFEGTIRYHNLKKEEIGALLSALSFHGNEDTHHHVIGMAKPLGYGEIHIEIKKVSSAKNSEKSRTFKSKNKDEYLDAFKELMNKNIANWEYSMPYKELLSIHEVKRAMHLPKNRTNFYPRLGNEDEGVNEFVRAKNNGEYLRLFSEIYGADVSPSKHAGSASPKSQKDSTNDVPPSIISNKIMKDRLQNVWHKHLGINFSQNQLRQYVEGGISAMFGVPLAGYTKIDKDEKWVQLCREIDDFYKQGLPPEQKHKLYNKLEAFL